jgi:F0F1-type ATP synthase assembly protein I
VNQLAALFVHTEGPGKGGLGIDWGLDKLFHTQPWLPVIFTGLGNAAGFRNLIVTSRDTLRAAEGDGKRSRHGKERT